MRERIYGWLLALVLCGSVSAEAPWKMLFNGKDLTGWEQKNGQALYTVEDGQIVGRTVVNTPNSFLCTKQFYSDFILELEFRVDPRLNSGVQIRSHSIPEYGSGRVHGYQVEIDPSERAWTGGIYDEAGRGWLVSLEDNPKARAAFRQNEWNHLRIEAVGDVIRTWMNDVPAVHLSDTVMPTGFIALQVHSVGSDKSKEGIQVRWRNIRIIDEGAAAFLRPMPLPLRSMDYQLGSIEASEGWRYLFDGKSTAGWRSAKGGQFPEHGWVIDNGVLSVLESGGQESAGGGDIITVGTYSDFDLRLEFKLTPGANSGIKYFVDPKLNQGSGSAIGLEYQLLDDLRHPDAKAGSHPNSRTLASLYDLIAADNRDIRPIGQWNYARILSKGNHVEHWLNGRRVLQYERKTDEFRKLVQESKYKIWPGFGEWDSGHILLQDHGNAVSFKNIKIRELK